MRKKKNDHVEYPLSIEPLPIKVTGRGEPQREQRLAAAEALQVESGCHMRCGKSGGIGSINLTQPSDNAAIRFCLGFQSCSNCFCGVICAKRPSKKSSLCQRHLLVDNGRSVAARTQEARLRLGEAFPAT